MTQNPCQTGVYQQPSEEGGPSETEESTPTSQLRRLKRTRLSNPKYANATIVEEATIVEPKTFEEASHDSQWIEAMKEEIDALEWNQTWDLVSKPRDVKPISCRWVYKIKRCSDGLIERYKAQLVVRGFS